MGGKTMMFMPKINRTKAVWIIMVTAVVALVAVLSLPVYWVVSWFAGNRVTGSVYLNQVNTLIYPGSTVLNRSSSVTYDPRDTTIYFAFSLPRNISFEQFYVWQKRRFEAKGWQIKSLSKDTVTVDGKYVPSFSMTYEPAPSMPITGGPLNVRYDLEGKKVVASSDCIWDVNVSPHINSAQFDKLFP